MLLLTQYVGPCRNCLSRTDTVKAFELRLVYKSWAYQQARAQLSIFTIPAFQNSKCFSNSTAHLSEKFVKEIVQPTR